ncbi:helix-turn-helix domain-containing protein [Oceanirhabdus sp. W0125-5]|uniref:helix-turn-helix domain-containing protein n=1 Tax=Oceanirhabdus sp. W0125-5 TaxID=2999116 RepID=UPI0022F2BED6|nr:helix-turn-helix transcriptional regulator [Oceanirhabdus sp. W0125-5]WBW96776.1 helix-turn-helix transcriptional regulator [Oceanirhabdus sp. W0125-5]
MDFTIVTQAQKLKSLRKQLGLKQDDLSGKNISRNLISMIESDKATLTQKTLTIIIDNLRKNLSRNHTLTEKDIEDLKITEEDQAKSISANYIEYIKNIGIESEKSFHKMLSLLNKHNLTTEKIFIYYNLGIVFRNEKLYEKAFKYFNLSKEFALMSNHHGEIYGGIIKNLLHCCNRLKLYNEGILIANNLPEDIPTNLYANILYNKAVLYKASKEYTEAIETLDFLCEKFHNNLDYNFLNIKSELLKGNCLREKGLYNDSLKLHRKIYNKILKKKDIDEIYLILVLENIIETTMILEDTYDNYLDSLVNIISHSSDFENNYTSAEICKFVSLAFNKLNTQSSKKLSREYIYKSLRLAKKHKHQEVIEFACNIILNESIKNNSITEVDSIKNEILELLSSGYLLPNSKIILLLIEFYIKNKFDNKALSIINFCKEKVS